MNFALHNAALRDDLTGCRFDLVGTEVLLARGTVEALQHCLDAIALPATPAAWSIRVFCSPYFARSVFTEHFRDRNPRAWAVDVTFEAALEARVEVADRAPTGVELFDTTYRYTRGENQWDTLEAVVIADFRGAVPAGLSPSTTYAFGSLVQARFDLGPVTFPAAEDRVCALADRCRDAGASVNWETTLTDQFG